MNLKPKSTVQYRPWPLVSEGKLFIFLRSAFPAALLVVTALALSACATTSMSESECLVADWVTVGFADGAAGRSLAGIDAYRESCADHGVSPDLDAYRSGHADGVATYCRRQNGFQVGRSGAPYLGVCPDEMEPDFLEAYNAARRYDELESAVDDTNHQIVSLNDEEQLILRERDRLADQIVSSETTEETRRRQMARIEEINARIPQIPVEKAQLEETIPRLELELREYRESLEEQGLL